LGTGNPVAHHHEQEYFGESRLSFSETSLIINLTSMDHASILGIDVASTKLDLCLSQAPHDDRYNQLPYTTEALDRWLGQNVQVKPRSCIVSMESTGDYHIRVAQYFLKKGFEVKIINPILTRQYTKATIRGAKNDKKDSKLLCQITREGLGDSTNLGRITNKKRELLRLEHALTTYSVQLQQQLGSIKRKQLSNTAGVEKGLARLIKQTKKFSKELVDQATRNRTDAEKYVDSIPGFAKKLAAVVVQEIGDIEKFRNSASLVAYAGLDPRIKESGKKFNKRGRITKRGSSYLRSALYLAANIARMKDRELNDYYQKKKSEGRHHAEALCIIARKLVYRIYAVWKQGRCYEAKPILS